MYANFWIIEWNDRGRGEEAIDTATTAQEALETVRRFLGNEIAFDESTGEDRPAFDVLFGGADPITTLTEMDDRMRLECDDGDFMVRRSVRFLETPQPAIATGKASQNPGITEDMVRTLKEDYLAWSGGFRPDEDDQVAVYVADARPAEISVAHAWAIINQWMADVKNAEANESLLPTPDVVVGPREPSDMGLR